MARRVNSSLCVFLLVVVALVVDGCASTQLVDVWKDESYSRLPIEKILIIVTAENERGRRVAEDSFVRAFRDSNVEPVASYGLLPGAVKINRETIVNAIEGKGFDVVLITSHEQTERTSVYVPGEVRTEVTGGGYSYRGWNRYDRREYRTIERPGYYDEQELIYLETSLYETTEGRLIWSARSESLNPQSVNELGDDLAKVVMERLKRDGFL